MEENKKFEFEDEINYRNVIRDPKRWFGAVYVVMIIVLLIVGIFYAQNITTMFMNTVPEYGNLSEHQFQDIAMKKGGAVAGVDITTIGEPTDEMLAKGQEIYNKTCASCHGEEGKGNGAAGASLNPPPRDFTQANNWTNGHNLEAMYKTMQEGIPGTGMTAYEYLPTEDKFALIHYIRTFGDFYDEITDTQLAQLDSKYKISEGQVMPNQIPVELAMKKIAEENAPLEQRVSSIKNYIESHQEEEGARLFKRIFNKEEQVLRLLNRSNAWLDSRESFIRIVNTALPPEVFTTNTAGMTQEDWVLLHTYLSRFYREYL